MSLDDPPDRPSPGRVTPSDPRSTPSLSFHSCVCVCASEGESDSFSTSLWTQPSPAKSHTHLLSSRVEIKVIVRSFDMSKVRCY